MVSLVNIMMFAHGGSLNRGCEAIVRSTTHLVKETLLNSKMYLASTNPDSDQIIPWLDGIYDGNKTEIQPWTWSWFVSGLRYKLFKDESYALSLIERNIIRHIPRMDVCLSIGGDNYCYGEQPHWYEINRQVKQHGKKLVLWCCSIGEEDMSERKLQDLRQFDLILARETLTRDMLQNYGLKQVELCADPAFTMAVEELPLPEGWQEGNTIGLNFSPLVRDRNPGAHDAVEQLIRYILETTDSTIALTPHVIQEGNNDWLVLREWYEQFRDTGRIILLPDHLNAVQYKGYITRMRFFIGARTHATIAAYSGHVPTMVLGYSVKSRGISRDIFGEEKLVLGIQDLSDIHKLRTSFDELVAEEQSLRRRLAESVPHIQSMSWRAAERLRDLTLEPGNLQGSVGVPSVRGR